MKKRLAQHRLMFFIPLALALFMAAGCSGAPKNAETTQSDNSTAAEAAPSGELPFASRGGSGQSPETARQLTVPAGTRVSIRLQSTVSSATAQPGQHFDAVLDETLTVDGRTVAERGTPVVGRVVQARRSGRLHDSGYLRLTLSSISVNGKQVPVQASSVFVQGAAHKKRNLAMIGGGSGAGALIGALAGGGKGALIGAGIGAAAGTTGAYATGKKEVGFGPERRLSFRLTQPLIAG